MNDGGKQFSAWFVAIGLSAMIFGGGSYWIKKNAKPILAPGEHGEDNDSSDEHADQHADQHGDEHAAASKHGDKHEEHAAASEHGDKHEEHAATSGHGDKHEEHAATSKHGDKHEEHAAASEQGDKHEEHAAASEHGDKHEEHAAASGHGDKHGDKHEEHATASPAHTTAPHWTYGKSDASGPANWGSLASNFYQCEKGLEQAPIDIAGSTYSSKAPKIVWHYDQAKLDVENNGHTIQSSDASKENYVTIDGEKYTLAQFHFHNPSEHRVKGIPSDLEMHFVHKNAEGKLAVIGVMINESSRKENVAFKPIWDLLPRAKNSKASTQAVTKLTALLPGSRDYFHYKGSLTTPPCSEGVRWFVLEQPVNISAGQVEMYSSIFEGSTNRPVQPVQGREIITNKMPALAH